MRSPDLDGALEAALIRLTSNFGVFTDEAAFALQFNTWTEAADRHPWLTVELVDAGLTHYLDRRTERDAERKVPPIGDFIGVCADIKRGADQRMAGMALPRPDAWPSTEAAKEASRQRLNEMLKAAKVGEPKPRTRAPQGEYRERQRTVTVEWTDGKVSTAELLDEHHARLANRWLNDHPAPAAYSPNQERRS